MSVIKQVTGRSFWSALKSGRIADGVYGVPSTSNAEKVNTYRVEQGRAKFESKGVSKGVTVWGNVTAQAVSVPAKGKASKTANQYPNHAPKNGTVFNNMVFFEGVFYPVAKS